MTDVTQQVPLPPSVEELIEKIRIEQNQPPPDAVARRELALLGEEAALYILRSIAGSRIRRTFVGFIMHMAKKYRNSDSNNNNESPRRVSDSPSYDRESGVNSYLFADAHIQDEPVNHCSPASEQPRCSELSSSSLSDRSTIPAYVALGELEFRKAFLILSYIGEKKLEEVVTADFIRKHGDLPMSKFESEIWRQLGSRYIESNERRMSVDWDSGKTHIYHCHISVDGRKTFKGPYLVSERTHLQRELGDDNVLLVKFAKEENSRRDSAISVNYYYTKYIKFARDGILVGLRLYRFFVFKDKGKEGKKKDPTSSSVNCYFVRMCLDSSIDKDQDYILSGKTVQDARSVFMHAHTVSSVAKYMIRLSLILSKTMKIEVDLGNVNIERIEDSPCLDNDGKEVYKDGNLLIHTDGTGFISEDLAFKCPKNVYKGKCKDDDKLERIIDHKENKEMLSDVEKLESHSGETPLLIQVRLFYKGYAVKGTLLVNKKIPPQTIQVRPSMIKVEADQNESYSRTCNSLELVNTSNQPKRTYLSKNLIALFSCGGVPDSFFEDIARNTLEDAQGAFKNRRTALKVSLNYGWDDFIVARMILCGIPLDETCLRVFLSTIMNEEKKSLQGGRLPITESYYLMGTVDPTGILKRDEVCIILNDGQVSWEKVLVYRNPGLHFGDIHVLKAVYVKELIEIVGNAKHAIFFPCKGPRSLADEIAGGDYDGDLYFVSRNSELIKHFKESEPWVSASPVDNVSNKRPSDLSPDDLEDELFKLFLSLRFQPSHTVGLVADSWLAIMDRLLTLGEESADEKAVMKKNMCRLIDIYYDALDAPKKGGRKIEVPDDLKADMFPHYMERDEAFSFKSTSVLGRIYDAVRSYEPEDLLKEITKLPCFDDVVPEPCKTKWLELYAQYRKEMSKALEISDKDHKSEATDEIYKTYTQILYEAAELELSPRRREDIYNEALAIYHISYDYGKSIVDENGREDVGKCKFAWKVAGSALCNLYALKQSERTMVCLPSVIKEIFS